MNKLLIFLSSTLDDIKYFETSAKYGHNIVNIFEEIAIIVINHNKKNNNDIGYDNVDINNGIY